MAEGYKWNYCRAGRIGSKLLLTAAHCVISDATGNVRDSLAPEGSVDVWTSDFKEKASLTVERVYIHPGRPDLAVIETKEPIPFGSEMKMVSGELPLKVALLVYSSQCSRQNEFKLRAFARASYVRAIAGEDGQDESAYISKEIKACVGDSGGPVLLDDGRDYPVIGVVSRSDNRHFAGFMLSRNSLFNHLKGKITRSWLDTILKTQ